VWLVDVDAFVNVDVALVRRVSKTRIVPAQSSTATSYDDAEPAQPLTFVVGHATWTFADVELDDNRNAGLLILLALELDSPPPPDKEEPLQRISHKHVAVGVVATNTLPCCHAKLVIPAPLLLPNERRSSAAGIVEVPVESRPHNGDRLCPETSHNSIEDVVAAASNSDEDCWSCGYWTGWKLNAVTAAADEGPAPTDDEVCR